MEQKRKEEKKVSPLEEGLGILGGLAIGAGLMYGGYKLVKHIQGKKEAEAPSASGGRPLSAISFESSDEGDADFIYGDDGDDSYVRRFSYLATQPSLFAGDIGVNFNEWRIPKKLTHSELRMAKTVCSASENELNINQADWEKAIWAVDRVLQMLLKEIKIEAAKYEGLVIEKYVRQGSSREGLKIHAPDEFDVLLQYHFDNLEYEVENIKSGDNVLPEIAYLRVNSTMAKLSQTHLKLYKKGVFVEMNHEPYLSTMALQEKIFKSIIASASDRIETRVNEGQSRDTFGFRIKLRTNPPSVNIRIELAGNDVNKRLEETHQRFYSQFECQEMGRQTETKKTVIDVDIVPGLLLSEDKVPDPTDKRRTMPCPTYAVFKWFTENHRSGSRFGEKPELLWRVCSSGYEKHVIDVARGKREQMHIVNALRIMKLYFRNMKQKAIDRNEPPPQVVTVLRSYHLKHIAFYCILFLRILNKVEISDIEDAVSYMLAFLGVCLEERKLPHFFQANRHIFYMFPNFKLQPNALRYDLFQSKRGDSLNQAMISYKEMKKHMFGVISESVVSDHVELFRTYVKSGNYY